MATDDERRFPQFSSDVGLGKTAVNALFLGTVGGVHLALLAVALALDWDSALISWCLYAIGMTIFHTLEFITTAAYQPARVTAESFLLNHSPQYKIAAAASWVEFWAEYLLVPQYKGIWPAMAAGAAVMAAGQAIRSVAMCTAKTNFNHRVQHRKADEHELVTWGIYATLRHPSYTGWFWWSVASQVLLGNPLCLLAYTAVSFNFFRERIAYEEHQLCNFFPDEYPDYRRRTHVFIPGIP